LAGSLKLGIVQPASLIRFGAIDLIRGHLKPKGRKPAFVRHLRQGFKQQDHNRYGCELRNALMHRRLDATTMSVEQEGGLALLAPVVVHSPARSTIIASPSR
jgi:hypothetical protein